MSKEGLREILREVGAAAAVGRVPMPLWQEARERYVLFPPYKPAVHEIVNTAVVLHISRNTRLNGEPLGALRRFLLVVNRAYPGIPTDVKLYMFGFVYAEEARTRARRAVLCVASAGQLPMTDMPAGLPKLRTSDGAIFTCSRGMVGDSPFLNAMADLCDLSTPLPVAHASLRWCELLADYYENPTDASMHSRLVNDPDRWLMLDFTRFLGLSLVHMRLFGV